MLSRSRRRPPGAPGGRRTSSNADRPPAGFATIVARCVCIRLASLSLVIVAPVLWSTKHLGSWMRGCYMCDRSPSADPRHAGSRARSVPRYDSVRDTPDAVSRKPVRPSRSAPCLTGPIAYTSVASRAAWMAAGRRLVELTANNNRASTRRCHCLRAVDSAQFDMAKRRARCSQRNPPEDFPRTPCWVCLPAILAVGRCSVT